MVVVVNFRIRADLHALADHDAFHAVDADAITKRRIAADLQRTAVHGQQLQSSVGTDVPAQTDGAALRDDDLRVRGKPLNAGIEKMMEMKQLHDPEFHRAEQHADQIKDESPQ